MKIGIICYPTFGGSGVLATELGMALSRKGHEIHFISYSLPVRLHFHPNIFFHEVVVPSYPLFDYPPYETALASTIVNVVKNNSLDLLHVHYAIPHASAAYFAKEMLRLEGKDLPLVTTLHGTDITLVGRDKSYSNVVEFSINASDAVTAVSEDLKRQTLEYFNVKRHIDVVPNFVDPNRFFISNNTAIRQAFSPNGEKVLMHISNFRKVKRIDDVIKIFDIVQKQLPAVLVMVGDGPERGNAEDLVRCLNLMGKVKFLGKQEYLNEILSASDLFLLPSQTESFGLAALEAMACGVPVVSSNAGGLGEINVDGVTGYMGPVGDVAHMAVGALKILSDEKILQQFKSNALAHVKSFDQANIIPLYESIYQKATQNCCH